MGRPSIPLEVASVFAGVCLATYLVGMTAALLGGFAHLGLGAVFLVTALRMARRRPDGARIYGIELGGLLAPPEEQPDAGSFRELWRTLRRGLPAALKELGWALGVAIVVFPPYAYVYTLWHQPPGPFDFELPPDVWDFALGQLVVVALPEEALFRGYFQSRLGELWPPRRRLLGATLSVPAWIGQSLLFGVIHLMAGGGLGRLSTFVPGLLFGWLRARRGGIGAAVFFHALSNLCAETLARSLW